MSGSLIAGAFWVIAASLVAFLPIRRQIIPATALGLAGLGLLVWIGAENGWVWTLLGLAAFASLFRNGFKAIAALLRGEKIEIPDE